MADLDRAFAILDEYFSGLKPGEYLDDLRRANPHIRLPCDQSNCTSSESLNRMDGAEIHTGPNPAND